MFCVEFSGVAYTGLMGEPETNSGYTTQDALRAIGHPLRLDILQVLRHVDHARAKDIAEKLDVPANSVSYHLRILARAGLIAESPEHARDRRDRVWRMIESEQPYVIDTNQREPEYFDAVGDVGLAAIEWIRAGWLAEAATHNDPGRPEEVGSATMRVTKMRLTLAESSAMMQEVQVILDKYGAMHRDEHGHDLPDEEGVRDFRVAAISIATQ